MPALLVLALVLAVVLGAVAALPRPAAALPHASAPSAPVRCYRGLGTWFDMYDYTSGWKNPDPAAATLAAQMKARGVVTLFIETANYHLPEGSQTLYRPDALGPIIEQCHAAGIKVVAWYLPGFTNMTKDWARSKAAIDFRSAGGQKFDSFTLDIEATMVKPATTRTRRLLALSTKIRTYVGSKYPLGACIMSPAGMTNSPSIWPGFPYAGLAAIYDVFVPMGYYTYHGDGPVNAYRDTRENIRIIRQQTGRPSIPIHVIGGDGAKSSRSETAAYVRALRENGVLGGGLYDFRTTSAGSWAELSNVRFNPRQTPALPLDLPYAAPLGYCGADRSHPKEVFYQTTRQSGDRVLRFRLYDVQAGEVTVHVWNGQHPDREWTNTESPLPAGRIKKWSDVVSLTIPASALSATGRNVIGFVALGEFPAWQRWGVRDVTLSAP
jgi:hypothetical protein